MLNLRALLPYSKRLIAVASANSTKCLTLSTLSTRNYTISQHAATLAAHYSPQTALQQQRRFATEGQPREEELKLIYYGTLASRMKMVKFFSLSTSVAGLAVQPVLIQEGLKIGGTGMAVLLCTVAGFFTFVTPLLLHFITKKYVTELHYNPRTDEYTATTISLFLQRIKTKFRPRDVSVPDVPGMFTSFVVSKRPLFVDPSLFDDPEHYVRIMGYDKPIDFKLQEPTDGKTSKEERKDAQDQAK